MTKQNPYSKLKENNVYTASKEELTLMLYEGALKFSNQAIVAIENKEVSKANDLIKRVQDIISELRFTLNKKYEISKELDNMYEYISRRLIDANLKKDKVVLEEVRDLIRDFRDTWKEAMKLARTK